MQILQHPSCEIPEDCPYLPGREKSSLSFLARGLNEQELDRLLARGWRKFGPYFFQPTCPGCHQCIPMRIPVEHFRPSRSQRRVIKKAEKLDVRFGPLRFNDRAYEIYHDHSLERFGDHVDCDSFLWHFYFPSGPMLQSEYWLGDHMIGIGFLDHCSNALSSIYFCYDPAYSHLGLGTLSVLREIVYTRSLGLRYYYLGYFVPGAERMAYKNSFRPCEHYDWQQQCWKDPATRDLFATTGKEKSV